MPSILSSLSPAQIVILQGRVDYTVRQAVSTTGTLVATLTNPGEFYLDDSNALFATNGVQSGDIVEITAGPITPLGRYPAAALYLDPNIDASVHVPSEIRLIVDGAPTYGGLVTYRVVSNVELLDELASITLTRAQLENEANPEILAKDATFTVIFDRFNYVCDQITGVYRWLTGFTRSAVTVAVLNNSAAGLTFTVLFPEDWVELFPNRVTVFVGYPPIDPFTIAVPDSEQEGKDEEQAEAPSVPLLGPLTVAYNDALDKEEDALFNQDAFFVNLQAEIADNDALSESGNLNTYYTAMSASITAARASIVLRLDDIADIRTANKARPNVLGLNFGTFAALQAEINAQSAILLTAPFTNFNNLRFTYIDLLVNRAYGTRTEYYSNLQLIASDNARKIILESELAIERALLQLP
jgi:hypothetical protein